MRDLWFLECYTTLERLGNYKSEKYIQPNVHRSTICNSQDMEATHMPIDRWMDEDVIWICNGMLLSHKKEWNTVFCSNMDGPKGYHIEWSKSDRERQISNSQM